MKRLFNRLALIAKVWKFIPFLKDYYVSSEVSLTKKVLPLLFIFGYIILPIDLIPDFLTIFGVTDDIVITTFIIQRMIKMAPDSLKNKYELL